MFILRLARYFLVTLLLLQVPLSAREFLLEGKAAYFLPTNHTFKKIYHGTGIYGVELTGEICNQFYGFFSADFLSKKGHSIGLCSPTKVHVTNLGIGLKYFVPFCYGDFYVGLGALPTHLRTVDCSSFVPTTNSKWSCGGIAKIGAYFDLPRCFFLDLFFDYSFVKVKFSCCPDLSTQLHSAHVNGCWFGVGLGYRFN